MSIQKNKTFCILPWIHLHVSQNGRVSPCCNNNRYLGNVRDDSLNKIWSGRKFNALREQFKNGLPDKRCNHCYHQEKSGVRSLRQLSNQKYHKEIHRALSDSPKPIYLDIRFSNICNFKCVTCWHGNSSAWFEEGSKRNTSENRIIKAFTNSFEELYNYFNEVKEIYFAGGEPLIMEEHYTILEKLKERNLLSVELRYNTNFSTLDYKGVNILETWNLFENVHVSASVDASYTLGENIRQGFNWKQFLENRQKMLEVSPKVHFDITPTISSLNLDTIPELHQTLVKEDLLEIDNIYLNILERPKEYNIQLLQKSKKDRSTRILEKHLEWLTTSGAEISTNTQFENLISYLNHS